mmetsp:Transcript_37676/g.47500  ORF Transcript_37676/g.47500 Transcript_37676/m.47500 type:complete len:553 (+) Transcript_37676:73-1731(+)
MVRDSDDEEWTLFDETKRSSSNKTKVRAKKKIKAPKHNNHNRKSQGSSSKSSQAKKQTTAKTARKKTQTSPKRSVDKVKGNITWQRSKKLSAAGTTAKKKVKPKTRKKKKSPSSQKRKSRRSSQMGILGVAYVDSDEDSDWVEGTSLDEEDELDCTPRMSARALKKTPTILIGKLKGKQKKTKKKAHPKSKRGSTPKPGAKQVKTKRQKKAKPTHPLLCIYDVGLLAPFLTQSMKLKLGQLNKLWKRKISDPEQWRDEELSVNYCVVGRRISKWSGRLSLLAPDAVYFAVQKVVESSSYKYIKSLDLRGIHLGALDNHHYPGMLSTIAKHCKQIRSLNLCYSYVDYAGWKTEGVIEKALIKLFPGLEKLSMELYDVKWLKQLLCGLPNLSALEFAGHLHSAASFPADSHFRLFQGTPASQNLHELSLVGLSTGLSGLRQIGVVCPNLRRLNLMNCSACLKPSALEVIGNQYPNLQKLVIQGQFSQTEASKLDELLVTKCTGVSSITIVVEKSDHSRWLEGNAFQLKFHQQNAPAVVLGNQQLPFQAPPNQYI